MNITGNTIVITGGGTGIGRALAAALGNKGNTVVIAGRRQAVLDAVTAEIPGIRSLPLDVTDAASIAAFAKRLEKNFPRTNVLINNSGVMRPESFTGPADVTTAEETINTNLLGPIRVSAALLPLLQKQPRATVINVTSGLAFVPLTATPTYSATKAAMHSYTESMRHQLRGTNVEVLELAPPYVQTELTGKHQAVDPRAMPLADYIDEVMALLAAPTDSGEILVERVKPLRFAESAGSYADTFRALNQALGH